MMHAYQINVKWEIKVHFIAILGTKHARNFTYIGLTGQ
jgi:hypothetical protein